jgi:hypothetical protein
MAAARPKRDTRAEVAREAKIPERRLRAAAEVKAPADTFRIQSIRTERDGAPDTNFSSRSAPGPSAETRPYP